MTEEKVQMIDPFAGFEFQVEDIVVTREFQAEKLDCLALQVDFGDQVDPSFFIGLGIRAGAAAGISAEGNVNMLSSIVQHRPVLLDETLTPRGKIEAVDAVPRGHRVTTDAWFEDEAGERVISVPRKSLRPDPNKKGNGAGERPAPVISDTSGLQILGEHQLTPEMTKAYSSEGNSIHYEEEAAQRAGFRAPIIGGGMGVHFLIAAIWGESGLARLDIDVYFRRPIFWDDRFEVAITPERDAAALVRGGKVLTEIRINSMEANP